MFWELFVSDNRILDVPGTREAAMCLLRSYPVVRLSPEGREGSAADPSTLRKEQLLWYLPLRLLFAPAKVYENARRKFFWPGASFPIPFLDASRLLGYGEPLRLSVQTNGRPEPADYPEIFISVSHSGSFTVLSVSDELTGVDLQQRRPVRRGLAERFFDDADSAMLRDLSSREAEEDLFFRLWTIHEAYAKFTGLGMSGGFSAFRTDFDSGCVIPCRNVEKERNFPCGFFTELTPPSPGYYLSAVSLLPDRKPVIRTLA